MIRLWNESHILSITKYQSCLQEFLISIFIFFVSAFTGHNILQHLVTNSLTIFTHGWYIIFLLHVGMEIGFLQFFSSISCCFVTCYIMWWHYPPLGTITIFDDVHIERDLVYLLTPIIRWQLATSNLWVNDGKPKLAFI